MTDKAVLFEMREHVGLLTLNRPDNRNSMTPELLDGFAKAVAEARAAHGMRALVITGRGPCFSAGADFKSGLQREEAALPSDRSFAMYSAFLSLLDVEVPVVAAMNGHAVGGGFGLSLLCDLRVANKTARYGANFCRIGLHSGMAISYTLPRLVGLAQASEMLYTGKLVTGERAEAIGYANYAVDAEEVVPKSMELANEIAASAPLAVRSVRAALRRGLAGEIREAARIEAFAQAESVQTEDAREGVAAVLEKREPRFVGR